MIIDQGQLFISILILFYYNLNINLFESNISANSFKTYSYDPISKNTFTIYLTHLQKIKYLLSFHPPQMSSKEFIIRFYCFELYLVYLIEYPYKS